MKVIIWMLAFLIIGPPAAFSALSDEAIQRNLPFPSLLKSTRSLHQMTLCGESVPSHIQDVRERLEKEILLILWDRAQVILWFKRASKYFPHFEKILKQQGLPDDLKYVAVIESSLRANAGSSKGAVGFWQFIPSTAKKYGLQVNRFIDERRNIIKSTRAACSYFKSLYEEFGSWPLAMAAYNMGEYGLAREISRQENQDYYTLYLYLETQRYVFKVIAAKEILEHPRRYGFELTNEDLYPVFSFKKAKLKTRDDLPLMLIARSAGTTFKAIKDLNPEIRGNDLVAGHHELFLPMDSHSQFNERFLKNYTSWRQKNSKKVGSHKKKPIKKYHRVRKGEGLSMIAQKYSVPLSRFLRWNKLNRNSVIHPGDRLVIYLEN